MNARTAHEKMQACIELINDADHIPGKALLDIAMNDVLGFLKGQANAPTKKSTPVETPARGEGKDKTIAKMRGRLGTASKLIREVYTIGASPGGRTVTVDLRDRCKKWLDAGSRPTTTEE